MFYSRFPGISGAGRTVNGFTVSSFEVPNRRWVIDFSAAHPNVLSYGHVRIANLARFACADHRGGNFPGGASLVCRQSHAAGLSHGGDRRLFLLAS